MMLYKSNYFETRLTPTFVSVADGFWANGGERRAKPKPADARNWGPMSLNKYTFVNGDDPDTPYTMGFDGRWDEVYECYLELPNAALDKIANAAANMALMAAQYRKTVSTFSSMAQSVVAAWRKFRRGSYKGFTDEWLKWQYGYLPTLMDLEDSVEALQVGEEIYQHIRVPVKRNVNRVIYGYESVSGKAWCTANIVVTVMDVEQRLSQRWGLSNLAALGWELIPFSFVFDHMIQVGSYLTRLDALRGVKIEGYVSMGQKLTLSTPNGVGRFDQLWRGGLPDLTPRLTYTPSDSLKHLVNDLALLNSVRREPPLPVRRKPNKGPSPKRWPGTGL